MSNSYCEKCRELSGRCNCNKIFVLGDKVYFNYEDGVMKGEIINFLNDNKGMEQVVLQSEISARILPLSEISREAKIIKGAIPFRRASTGAEE